MTVGDYNGWNDAPEDEREALDLVEPTLTAPSLAISPLQPDNSRAKAAEATRQRRAA